ncbi:MAG: hypothetical protein KAQ87_05130 [Candidatus Pacebacteria bacterium]|nr:hypothetical protein [Candidatus Paceibacterota bacterium]
MPKKQTKNFHLNIPAILLCVVFVFAFFIKANSSAQIQFTADTIISLSGINDGDLYVRTNSECAEISASGAILTITDIPIANDFILKTISHDNALKLTPADGVLDLTLDGGNISSGNITQWTLNASSGTTAAHIVGVANANTWYAIKTDGVLFNTFQSNSSGEVSFTYNGSWSEKVFTIEVDETNPTEFSLVSPVHNHSTSDSSQAFLWNASSDPDVSYYQLYIDGGLDTSSIANTSTIPTNSLSCGSHTWYVKTIDNAGNSTDSSTFNLTMACASGMPPSAYNPPSSPEPTEENTEGGFSVLINNDDEYTNGSTVNLKLLAGKDTTKMALSNNFDFKYASIIPYQKTMKWDLSSRNETVPRSYEEYTIYAKFYTQYGIVSEVVSDSIIYSNESSPVIPNGSLIRAINNYKVYITNNPSTGSGQAYKRHILDGEIFNFYGHLNWDNVQEVSSSQLNNYQESFLIRELNDYKVYEIKDKTKRWLDITAEEFIDLGYKWEEVFIVNEEELGWHGN